MYPSKQLSTPDEYRSQVSAEIEGDEREIDEAKGCELTPVVDTRVEPDDDALSNDTLEERSRPWQFWLLRLFGSGSGRLFRFDAGRGSRFVV